MNNHTPQVRTAKGTVKLMLACGSLGRAFRAAKTYPNHLLHRVLSVITLGLWLPVCGLVTWTMSARRRSKSNRVAAIVAWILILAAVGCGLQLMI